MAPWLGDAEPVTGVHEGLLARDAVTGSIGIHGGPLRAHAVDARRATLATLLGLAMAGAPPLGEPEAAVGASHPYRVDRFDLQDVCPDGLSFTGDAPLPLPARPPRDEHGVPMIIVDGERHYRPGALAINGMKRIDAYGDMGDAGQLDQAIRQAAQLRAMSLSRRRAAWVPFLYDYLPEGQDAPWFNAMTQGLVLSFYVRLYVVTSDEQYLHAAHHVFRSFLRLGRLRPTWVAYTSGQGYLWLEHYPSRRPDHVLNAHLHGIFGLYEYWQVTRSKDARSVLQGAITTMRARADRYRQAGGLSLYGLRHRTSRLKYHEIHVWQLRLLASLSGDAWFDRLAGQLSDDVRSSGPVPGRPAIRGPAATSPACRRALAEAPRE
jgi:hypothetical protein